MSFLQRRKSLDAEQSIGTGARLRATLSWPHLVGSWRGSHHWHRHLHPRRRWRGDARARSHPRLCHRRHRLCVRRSWLTRRCRRCMPVSGSAYTYTRAVRGELPAWIVGWSLILEYTVVCAAVAVGWSGYAAGFLKSVGVGVAGGATEWASRRRRRVQRSCGTHRLCGRWDAPRRHPWSVRR